LESVSKKLDGLERELANYQQTVGIVVPEVEASAAVTELQQYRRELNAARTELESLNARKRTLRRQLAAAQPLLEISVKEPNPERELIEMQLRQAQVNLATLRARYKDDHPSVSTALRRIEALEARLSRVPELREVKRFDVNPQVQALNNEINSTDLAIAEIQRRTARLEGIVAELASDTADLPLELATISRLRSQIELARSTYQTFMVQLEQSKLREAIKESGATVIDRAVDAEEIKPNPGRMMLFAFALGLFSGLMFALLLEALDDTFHGPEDLTYYTDIPFLGMVPMLETSSDELVTITAPKSPPAEAYRALRTNINFAQVDSPSHTYVVTSAGAGEGKSLTITNLAVVFAQAGQRVLLIDSDLRRPAVRRLLRIERTYGLTNVLIGEATLEDVIIEMEQVPGLYVVPTGPLPPNPADLLDSDRMTEVIRDAARFADIVFLDSPPAIILTDAVLLSSKVDQTILVAECDHVSRAAFTEMVRLIRHARGNILGVILNKLRLSTSDYYYYYYYYYNYSGETPVPKELENQHEAEPTEPVLEALEAEAEPPTEPEPAPQPPPEPEPPAPQPPPAPPPEPEPSLLNNMFADHEPPAEAEPEPPPEGDVEEDTEAEKKPETTKENGTNNANNKNRLLDNLLGLNDDE